MLQRCEKNILEKFCVTSDNYYGMPCQNINSLKINQGNS